MPVPPIYQPEVAARSVLYAADHPGRKQFWVGDSTAATPLIDKVAAPLLDRYLARTAYQAQQTHQEVACLAPQYTLCRGMLRIPSAEPTCTMVPRSHGFMRSRAARVP